MHISIHVNRLLKMSMYLNVAQVTTGDTSNENGIICKSIEQAKSHLRKSNAKTTSRNKHQETKRKTKSSKQLAKDTILQDVFGDYMCGVFDGMQEYWSQFGFMDAPFKQQHVVIDMLDIIKSNDVIKVKPMINEDDDLLTNDEDF